MSDTSSISNLNNNALDVMALGATPSTSKTGRGQNGSANGGGSWFEALALAWGQSLDQEASKLQTMSDGLTNSSDEPSQIADLTAESLRMSFLSQSEQTSIGSAGQSLQTMARKD